jgi:hypothetical protein
MPMEARKDNSHTARGGMRRTHEERRDWDIGLERQLMAAIHLDGSDPRRQLQALLREATAQQENRTDPLFAARSGISHYLRFCERIGEEHDVAPEIGKMKTRVAMWMQDAPQQYAFAGKPKKRISSTSIPGYPSNIDTCWSTTTCQPKCLLSKQAEVITRRKEMTASARSAQRQVHIFNTSDLQRMHRKAAAFPKGPRDMPRSAHTLAGFAMLRPTEYMTTPFRVGGAQAMAIAGRSVAYIMAQGRWKHIESVM